jgi:hypothetical protein
MLERAGTFGAKNCLFVKLGKAEAGHKVRCSRIWTSNPSIS